MTSTVRPDLVALCAVVSGPVLTPGDPGYAEETAGFNVAHRVAAAVVVAAVDAADVAAAVRGAAAAGLTVRAQATGHGLVDDLAGVLLISTRRLDTRSVDPVAGTARVGAGVRWRAVVDAAAPHGLAPLNGSASGVGAVGYTLGGGVGPLARRYGFAADHVRALTLVTADGAVRRIDPDHDADLVRAVRGGRPGFGVVTEMEIGLVPVARFVGGGLFFPGESAAAVLDAWARWAPTMPDGVTTSVALLRLPPDPQLPPPLQGRFVVHLRYVDLGDTETATQRLAPLRAAAPVLIDTVTEMPYAAVDAVHMDPPTPMPVYDRGLTLGAFTPEIAQTLVQHAGAESGTALVMLEVRLLGGALGRPAAVPDAVAGRDAAFGIYTLAIAAGPAAELGRRHVDALVAALAPHRTGALLNFLGHPGPGEPAALWSAEERQRLTDTARRHDPDGIFGGALTA